MEQEILNLNTEEDYKRQELKEERKEEIGQKIRRDLREDFIQTYRPLEQEQDFLIEDTIQDLKGINKELSKRGIYPIKNISYSVVKHLCGFKTYKRVYEGFINLLGKKKILNMDYDKLTGHFLKDYTKLNKKYETKTFLKIIIRPKEITPSYKALNQITKSISFKYNNQIKKGFAISHKLEQESK